MVHALKPRREAVLPAAIFVFGVGLSTTWAILLAYAFCPIDKVCGLAFA